MIRGILIAMIEIGCIGVIVGFVCVLIAQLYADHKLHSYLRRRDDWS